MDLQAKAVETRARVSMIKGPGVLDMVKTGEVGDAMKHVDELGAEDVDE